MNKWVALTLSLVGAVFIGLITSPLIAILSFAHIDTPGSSPSLLEIFLFLVWSTIMGVLPSIIVYKKFGHRKLALILLVIWPLVALGIGYIITIITIFVFEFLFPVY